MYRVILSCTLMLGLAAAQEPKSPPPAQKSEPQTSVPAQKTTPIAVSRSQRLGAAKTAFIKKVEGSEIPVNVITNSMEGWGRYTLVNSPDKADLLIEIASPEEQPSSVTINTYNNPITGRADQSTSTSRNISNVPIKMSVLDAKTRLPLWSAVEQPKRAMKQKTREDNLVEAAQSLFSKFHQVVEPQ